MEYCKTQILLHEIIFGRYDKFTTKTIKLKSKIKKVNIK